MVSEKLEQAPWQVTATTIYCPLVESRVTILVKKDWEAYCVWWREHNEGNVSGRKEKKMDKCLGEKCSYVTDYRDRLIKSS